MKVKINKLIFAIFALVSMLFLSCSDLSENGESTNESHSPVVRISIDGESARTALPSLEASKLSKFVLTGKSESYDANDPDPCTFIGSDYATGLSWTSYDAMKDAIIPVVAGKWDFTLVANIVNNRNITVISYTSVKNDVEIGESTNNISFTLVLDSLATSGTGIETGTLTSVITLGSEVDHITGQLFKKNGTSYTAVDGSLADLTYDSGNAKYTYSKDGLLGVYLAQYILYADADGKVPVASYREAVNINQLGAVSTFEIESLDEVYDITYLERVNFKDTSLHVIGTTTESDNVASSTTNPEKYSRRSTFTLSDAIKTGYTFWHWVDAVPVKDGDTITGYALVDDGANEIATVKNIASLGDKYFCAEFINEEAKPRIVSVDLSGTVKVGNTLTAKAYADENCTTPFTGEVTWKWYVSDSAPSASNLGTLINPTSESNPSKLVIKTGDTDPTLGNTTTLLVPPEYAGKYISAVAMQNYIVTMNGTTVTNVFKNDAAYATEGTTASYLVSPADYSSFDAETSHTNPVLVYKASNQVAKGTLSGASIALAYLDGANSKYTVIGTALDNTAFKITDGSLKDATNNWTYASSNDQTNIKFTLEGFVTGTYENQNPVVNSSVVAPADSREYSLKFKIELKGSDGNFNSEYAPYEGIIDGVHLHVQAAAPSSETITFRDPCMVTYGNFRFKNTNPSETATENLQYSLNGTTWYDWNVTSSSLGDSYSAETVCEIAAGTSTSVYVRTVGTEFENSSNETAITNVEANGYIKPSAPVTIILKDDDSENPVNHIGTLVRLTGIAFNYHTYASENTAGNPEVGTRISLTPASAVTDQSVTGTYDYTWSVKDSNGVVVTGGTGAGSTFDLDNGSYAGNTLYATVVVTYPTANGDTAEDSLAQRTFTINKPIAKGNMDLSEIYAVSEGETPTITTQNIAYYNTTADDTKLIPGSTPDSSKLHIINEAVVKNELGTLSGVTYTFPDDTIVKTDADSTKTLPVSVAGSVSVGTTPVTVSAVGYNSKTIYVAIPIDTNIAKTLLSDNISTIPYGHILFKTANDGETLEYRVLKTGATDLTSDDSYYAGWARVTSEPLNKADSYSTSSVLSSNYLFADTDVVYVRYVGTETELALSLTDSDTSKTYVGTRSASVTVSISESAEYISVSGTNVVAPSTWTNCKWTVDDVVIDNSTTMLSITTAVSGKYHVLIEAVDSYDNPVSDEAWVTVTIR